jgi:hypothetical protein
MIALRLVESKFPAAELDHPLFWEIMPTIEKTNIQTVMPIFRMLRLANFRCTPRRATLTVSALPV